MPPTDETTAQPCAEQSTHHRFPPPVFPSLPTYKAKSRFDSLHFQLALFFKTIHIPFQKIYIHHASKILCRVSFFQPTGMKGHARSILTLNPAVTSR